MKNYQDLIRYILKKGHHKNTRGIVGIKSVFGYQLRFDFRKGFPILTTKKVYFKTLYRELLWFISGSTSVKDLHKYNIHYWDGFADKSDDLGPVYGYQWRKWPDYKGGHIDQLKNVINEIKYMPDSKAMLVSAWNVAQLKEMRLPPCHSFFQFNVIKGKLRLQLYMRSSDVFLGLPFNISQYALLLAMVAQVTGLKARELIISIGDAHIYENHLDAVKEILKRKPYRLPKLWINKDIKDIDDFTENDVKLIGYKHHPAIKAPLVII